MSYINKELYESYLHKTIIKVIEADNKEDRPALAMLIALDLALEEFPTEQDVRKHGAWQIVDATEPRRYGCPFCKRLSWDETNFCANCGAELGKGGN